MKRIKAKIYWVDPFGHPQEEEFPTLKQARYKERFLRRNHIEYLLSKIKD